MDEIAILRNRLVVQECALAALIARMDAIEERIAEIDAQARIQATAQVVAIVKAELDRKWDDTTMEALYRVLERLGGEQA